MKILIAEDEQFSRQMLQTILIREGHGVIAVEDGQKALEIFDKEVPDMLITDWMMPELDGLDLCRKVRALNLSSYVYIVLLTALTDKERIIEGLDAGADDSAGEIATSKKCRAFRGFGSSKTIKRAFTHMYVL